MSESSSAGSATAAVGRGRNSHVQRIFNITLGLFLLATVASVAGVLGVGAHYRSLIYPGITIAGLDVGGLTPTQAEARVRSTLPSADQQRLLIEIAGETWELPWATAGQVYDVSSAVDAAYAVGRDRRWWLGALNVISPQPADVSVPLTPARPDEARAYVETLAEQVTLAPVDATLSVNGGELVATPAQEGRRLDVNAATDQVLAALAEGAEQVQLEPEPVPAQITTVEPAYSEAQALLAAPFIVTIDDPLTGDPDAGGYHAEFAASPGQMASWIEFHPVGDAYEMEINRDAVRAWVDSLAPQVGEEELVLDTDATFAQVLTALETPEHQVTAPVTHPERTYVVEPGDNFYDIAYSFGFSQWHLQQANPDIDPEWISVGQVITVPSIDILFPHALVPDKRIAIDLPTQTLRAYEDDAQIFEFKISSGISTTPTLAGKFQILFKEENAFARRWSLDMPYFMAFYEEREDFYNGMHELPITSYGAQLSPYVLGWPASYGCIILDEGDAEALYNWAEVGTLVHVTGVAPGTPFGQQTLSDIAPPVLEENP